MKKFLVLILLVGGLAAAFVITQMGAAAKVTSLVEGLADFTPPTDPYKDPIKKPFKDKKGNTVMLEVIEPWEFDHDAKLVVRAAWARRNEGTFEPIVEVVKDTTKSANQRIGAMLALGFYNDASKANRKIIIETLVPQLENTADRVAEFAAFALGHLGKKDVDVAVGKAAESAKSDEARYYCLVALRDNRISMDPNAPFSEEAGAALLAALESQHDPSRKLAALDAHWLRTMDAEATAKVVHTLLGLLKDKDQDISNASRDAIQKKMAELVGTPAFNALPEGVMGVYESDQVHTRANAVWVAGYYNNQADDAEKIGQKIPKKFDVLNMAWDKDQGEPAILAAAAAGLGRHGTLEQKIKVTRLLLDGPPAVVADGVHEGVARMTKDRQDKRIVDVLLEAITKDGPAAGAAGKLLGEHGEGKAHAQAVLEALKAAKDDAAKEGLLAGGRVLVNDPRLKTADDLEKAINNPKTWQKK